MRIKDDARSSVTMFRIYHSIRYMPEDSNIPIHGYGEEMYILKCLFVQDGVNAKKSLSIHIFHVTTALRNKLNVLLRNSCGTQEGLITNRARRYVQTS